MFPHDKLDWNLSRLEKRLADGETDPDVRLAYAAACISRARFHGGGDSGYNDALTQARRVLHHEPGHPTALVIASLALVLLDRAEAAERYLEEARRTAGDDPRLHIAIGEAALQVGDSAAAETAFATATRLSPESWEGHLLLGRLLTQLARRAPPTDATAVRRTESAQYHLVRALQLGPSEPEQPPVLYDLATLCLRTGKVADGQRLLTRLLDHDAWRAEARYHLGRVAARTGKHKKAILYFRQHLSEASDERAEVWARIGACHLHLGEPHKAREACNRALALDPDDIEARWILGSALIAEGQPADAARAFREILEIAPDHQDAFSELVRLRAQEGDLRWLRQALRSETAVYDRLPATALRPDPRHASRGRQAPPTTIDPRSSTRHRVRTLVRGMGALDANAAATVLECLDLTTDEGLRFLLWDGALDLLARRRAGQVNEALAAPGRRYSVATGKDVLTLAHLIGEERLTVGLDVSEDDLRRAAVERHGPASDVGAHRTNIAAERQQARAWQGLLLLAIASKATPSARNLLVRWSSDADPELGVAARAGLAMTGDADATRALRGLAAEKQVDHLIRLASALGEQPNGPEPALLVTDRDDLVCATCGRRGGQVSHMIVGRGHAVCNVCMSTLHERRAELTTRDPELACALTGATLLDADALYVYQGTPISSACVEQSLGHEERETVAAWLAAL